MLNIGAKQSAPDVTQLSNAELIAQLAQQVKGIGRGDRSELCPAEES